MGGGGGGGAGFILLIKLTDLICQRPWGVKVFGKNWICGWDIEHFYLL